MNAPLQGRAPQNIYSSYQEFFDFRLADLFARNPRLTWCAQWEQHPEAVAVIESLWQTWEVAQRPTSGPEGMAVWLRDFAYPLLFDRLTIGDGTFSGCSWRDENIHAPDTKPLPRE